MAFEYKKASVIKTVLIADADVFTGHPLNKNGIVKVGERAGIVMEKIDDKCILVCFDTNRDFVTDLFDESALPKVGEKIYLQKSDGKLTKNNSGTVFIGYYWGKKGKGVVFSLHA